MTLAVDGIVETVIYQDEEDSRIVEAQVPWAARAGGRLAMPAWPSPCGGTGGPRGNRTPLFMVQTGEHVAAIRLMQCARSIAQPDRRYIVDELYHVTSVRLVRFTAGQDAPQMSAAK